MYTNERCLIFDESGNLGASGRYFVIACIDTQNCKALHNMMKRKLRKAKDMFPELAVLHSHEVKAKDAYPCVKYHILETIAEKDLKIHYIVADLKHIRPKLLEDKNILYNYLMKLLLDKIISSADNGTTINIISDNHTTKIASGNSFEEYIKIHFIFERGYDLNIKVAYMDSDASDAYIVQAADYVANALYTKFEYCNHLYSDQLNHSQGAFVTFPYYNFGK